jgi:hypothetical protein
MTCAQQNFLIQQGKTFSRVIRWGAGPFVYAPITGITKAAPAVVTATAHGMPDGWPAAIVSVVGMRQINAKNSPPRSTDFHKGTVTSSSVIAFNDINSSAYDTYTSGGYVQYYTPASLAAYTAEMQIRLSPGSADPPLLDITTSAAPPASSIVLDDTAKTITILISATDTAAFTFVSAVYDLQVVSAGGVVTQLLEGIITVDDSVTHI